MQLQFKLTFPQEPGQEERQPPPAWESLEAEGRARARSHLAQLIARMLVAASAADQETSDD